MIPAYFAFFAEYSNDSYDFLAMLSGGVECIFLGYMSIGLF